MRITPQQYVSYVEQVAAAIASQGDYITALDSATGDGDHWLNLNIGYQKLVEQAPALREFSDFAALFKQLARSIMTGMGGTSGALYGSMYLAAAKRLDGVTELDCAGIASILSCWASAIMERGNTKPGQKTMLDTILPVSQEFAQALKGGKTELEALEVMRASAWRAAESTKEMEAMRGRASNQPEKGVGHLDPGAVTMAIQLECLANFLQDAGQQNS